MNPEHYLQKVKSYPSIKSAELKDNNIIAYSDAEHKQQLEWNIICTIYDKHFTKHINKLIVL